MAKAKKTRASKKSSTKFGFKPSMATRKINKPQTTKAAKNLKKSLSKSKKIITIRPKALTNKVLRKLQMNKPGMSFKRIYSLSPPKPDHYNANMVRFIKNSSGRVKLADGSYRKGEATMTRTQDDKKGEVRKWRQVVYARDENYSGPLHKCPQIVLRCECPRHMFMWEHALWNIGAAEIMEPSTGETPQKHNIPLKPGCCIVGSEKIFTREYGAIPIREITEGMTVAGSRGWTTVKAARKTKTVRKFLRIYTSNGSVACTNDHLIMVIRSDGAQWVKAEDVMQGDRFVTPLHKREWEGHVHTSPELARLLGYMISEGSYSKGVLQPVCGGVFANENEEINEDFDNCIMSEYDASICWRRNGSAKLDAELYRKLEEDGLPRERSEGKYVPDRIFKSSYEAVTNFISALYDGDGWVSEDCKFSTYGSKSKKLVKQLQTLLLMIGVRSCINKNISGINKTTMWLLRTSSPFDTTRLLRQTNILKYKRDVFSDTANAGESARTNVRLFDLRKRLADDANIDESLLIPAGTSRLFRNEWGMSKDKLKKWIEAVGDNLTESQIMHLQYLVDENTVGAEVTKIKTVRKKKDVYDLETTSADFLVNGHVVHNCEHLLVVYEALKEKNR